MSKKFKLQKRISMLLVILMVFSIFTDLVSRAVASSQELQSPIINEDNTITFNYLNDEAERVQVAGSFTNWAENALEMNRSSEGYWTITTEALEANVYEYKFIVGEDDWTKDPLNANEINENSRVVVPGINLASINSIMESGTSTELEANIISESGDITKGSTTVHWSLENAPEGVTVEGANLTISSDVLAGETFTIVAEKDGYMGKKEVEISEGLYKYTINYHRLDNDLEDWNLWIYNGGLPDAAYDFSDIYGEEIKFAKGTFKFPEDDITIIPRKGNWEIQDAEWKIEIPGGQMETEVWLLQGYHQIFTSEADAIAALEDSVVPHIRLVYEREDQNYDGWNVWVWNTGAQDGQIDFTEFQNGKAIAEINVGPDAQQVGFIVRKGDWEEKDVDMDRFIYVNTRDPITKVYVKSGEEGFFTVPSVEPLTIDNGNVTFHFRDKDLYLKDAMSRIEKVELNILGESKEMTREEKNERFVFTYENIPEGEHEYTYLVTMDGETVEVEDQYFSGSFSYYEFDIEVSGTVLPEEIDYNQNAVLSIDISNKKDIEIREIYVDLTEVGGPEKVAIDPELMAITIAVEQSITAGVKTLPFTIIDMYGNEHISEAQVTVKPRQFVGEIDFDWDEAVIYFVLTDRFFNGDVSNDDPYEINYDKEKPGVYQGGDFKGITEKLDYLADLGINTIWISPIVENIAYDVRCSEEPHITPYYAYHGYWGSNFSQLNPHFGTMEDFHELIDEAHKRGIKIMVDVVLNHAGYGLKMTDKDLYDDPIPHFPTDEDRARFEGMFRDGGTDTVKGELSGLPDFITEDPEVRRQIIQWQTQWIDKSRTEKGNTIDYFRVDTVKHVEDTTWMAFKNALTQKVPEFKLIGESWGAGFKDDHGYLNVGMMDSLLDFDFKYQAADFVKGNITKVERDLKERNEKLTNTATLGQFLGSHDEPGFLYQFEDDDKLGKFMVAASLQITAKGQPVIYYGEELGLYGDNNYPYYDNRYNMDWDKVGGNPVHEHYRKVLKARNEYSKVFSKGTRKMLEGSDQLGYSIFERAYGEEVAIVGLNTKNEAQNLSFDVPFKARTTVKDVYSGENLTVGEDRKITITLPGMQDGGTFILVGETEEQDPPQIDDIQENHLRIHYQRTDGDYTDLGVWIWGDVKTPSENWPTGGTPFNEQLTDYGAYVDIELKENPSKIGFLVLNVTTGDKDEGNNGGDKEVEIFSPEINEVWIKQGSDEVFLWEPTELPEDTVRVHYERADETYDNWGIWVWGDVETQSQDLGGWPQGATDLSGVGKYGAYYDIELREDAKSMGFLFVNKETSEQTADLKFDMLDQYNEIFVKNDSKVYTNPFGSVPITIVSGELLSDSEIELKFSKTEGLVEAELMEAISVVDENNNNVEVAQVNINDETTVGLTGDFSIENTPYYVTYEGKTVTVVAGWRAIDEIYGYDGQLGAVLHSDGTATIKLWSPKAENVSIRLYDKDDQFKVVKDDIQMVLGDSGVWEITLNKENTGLDDLRGYFYHYCIDHGDGEPVLALDPYAKSMAAWADPKSGGKYPIGKAAIVDPSTIGPELDYANIPGYEKREDGIIYEVHVRDFTSDENIADELVARFGTFAAFAEKLDYIESLGVTHIQLLPVMSYYWGNEWASGERLTEYSSTDNNYNWGYDPHSYFSLTGMYSENPDDPELRIEEFKRLIDEIHSRNMGVILDVVYNHTARVDIFEDLVPNYYHFMDADGTPKTSFGGGRLGTTHKMSRRILVDSILYWTEEFKVDGFRFDMMGDHDAETIQIAYDEAKKLNPNIIMIGEGWRTYEGDQGHEVMAADQDWMQYTEAVGSFSDEFRNELKSGFGCEGEPRFITAGPRNIQQIFDNIKAQPHNFVADQPGDVVSYIAAHDNLTLFDVIAQSIKGDPDIPEKDLEIHKRIRLGNAMVLTSQGTAFIHAGQEYGRTKQYRAETTEAPNKSTYMVDENGKPFKYPYFIHDSYNSSDIINRFDWEKATNEELYPVNNLTREYTTGLIHLRRSSDAFTMGSKELVDEKVILLNAPEIKDEDLIIAYRNEATNGDAYYVFINADDKERTLSLEVDLTSGTVLVDNDEAGTEEVSEISGFLLTEDKITIEPLTVVVIKVEGEAKDSEPSEPEKPVEPSEPVDSEELSDTIEKDSKDDTQLIGKKEVEVKIKNGVANVVIDEDKIVKRVEELKKKTDKDKEAILVLKLDDTKDKDLNIQLPKKLFTSLSKENISINIVADDVEFVIPSDVLGDVNIPEGSNIILKLENMDKNAVKYNAEDQDVKKVINLNLEIVKNGKITEAPKFKSPIVVKIDVKGLGDKDKLAAYYLREQDNALEFVTGKIIDNQVVLNLDHFSKYIILESNKTFEDIANHWAKLYVESMVAKNVIHGYSDETFRPNDEITRAEFVVMMINGLETELVGYKGQFTDVSADEWYADYIATIKELGFAKGYGDGTFRPNDKITRTEAAVMLSNIIDIELSEKEIDTLLAQFTDKDDIAAWAVEDIAKVVKAKVMEGNNGKFLSNENTTRAEVATIIYRIYNR